MPLLLQGGAGLHRGVGKAFKKKPPQGPTINQMRAINVHKKYAWTQELEFVSVCQLMCGVHIRTRIFIRAHGNRATWPEQLRYTTLSFRLV